MTNVGDIFLVVLRINVGISRVCCAKLYYLNDVSFFILPVLFLLAETTRSAWWPCSPGLGKNFPCGRAFYGEVQVQIFCLINCAPLHNPPIKLEQIKLGQLTFLTKWDNSDFNTHVTEMLTLKSLSFFFFFFFHSFYFFSVLAFGFSSPCGLFLAATFGIDLDSSPILSHCNPFSQSQSSAFAFVFVSYRGPFVL